LQHALNAKKLNPKLWNLHYNLAQIYEMKGQVSDAVAEYLTELENYPDNYSASFNLALLFRQTKKQDQEEKYLKKTIELSPGFSLGYLYLGELYYSQHKSRDQSIALLEKAVSLGLDKKHLKYAYYLLAKIHLEAGNQAAAARYAQKIRQLNN